MLKTPQRRSTIFIVIFVYLHFFLLFLLLTLNKTQLNVCWVSPYQLINAGITNCCNYLQMYKNLSAIVRELIRDCDPKQSSCSKKNFFSLQRTIFNNREPFFSEHSLSLLYESGCGQPFLNGKGIFQESISNHKLQIYNAFDKCFDLRYVAISKKHFQPYI